MVRHIAISQARKQLPELVREVNKGESFILERGGKPLAMLVPFHEATLETPQVAISQPKTAQVEIAQLETAQLETVQIELQMPQTVVVSHTSEPLEIG